MKFFSTHNKNIYTGFEEAVINGLAPDGGLYMPEEIPVLDSSFFDKINEYNINEIAFRIISRFTGDQIKEPDLQEIINSSFTFKAPLYQLEKGKCILELFHGPTLAFKDFGARFMARCMEHFVKKRNIVLNILVATSGDTGSAVANGFYNVEGINVYILYPSGKVSFIQEQQLTTLDKNITALEINGTFDDCQRLVKQAFVDPGIKNRMNLSSANSINISRLLPQSVYYFESYKQLENKDKGTVFSVPSGNLGNLTAGIIAHKMGLPVKKFIGATNSNDTFTKYIKTGRFEAVSSHRTYSNAMDVGNPSNLDRIKTLYDADIFNIRDNIFSVSHTDHDTLEGIKEVYEKYNYIIDPHGAVGYLAAMDYKDMLTESCNYVILETAHPAKFRDIVEETLGIEIELPERLKTSLEKKKHSIKLSGNFDEFKEFLLEQ
ncbi:MAG: threonine synthase [Melioribacteraceae bacterium]|nr:threonine synthase [Melioribacteraceae bacterium]